MKIESYYVEEISIQEFADTHNLIMEVHERYPWRDPSSAFYAHFKNCEVKGNGVLISNFGNGATEDLAIQAYADEISGHTIVIDAFKNRREIKVPKLFSDNGD